MHLDRLVIVEAQAMTGAGADRIVEFMGRMAQDAGEAGALRHGPCDMEIELAAALALEAQRPLAADDLVVDRHLAPAGDPARLDIALNPVGKAQEHERLVVIADRPAGRAALRHRPFADHDPAVGRDRGYLADEMKGDADDMAAEIAERPGLAGNGAIAAPAEGCGRVRQIVLI